MSRLQLIPRALVVLLSLLVVTTSCVVSDPEIEQAAGTETGGPEGTGSGAWAPLDEPIVMTEGEFVGSVYDDQALLEAGRAVQDSHDWDADPPFVGTVNGILVDPDRPSEWGGVEPCDEEDGVRRATSAEIEQHGIPTPVYLPPGTIEWHDQLGAMCGDTQLFWVMRQFLVRPYELILDITKMHENPALFSVMVPTSRVAPGEVNGKAAVFIEPWSAEGFGNSWIAWVDGPSTYIVGAVSLPFDEVIKVAEGLEEALQGV